MQQEHAEKLEKFLAGVEELAKLTPEHRGLLMQLLLLEVYRDKQRISGSGRKRWLHIVYTGRIAAKKEGGDAGELSAVFTRGDVVEIEDGLLKGHGEGLILVAQGICQVLQVPLIEGNVDSDDDDEEEEAWAEPCLEEDEDEDEEAEGEEEKEGEDEDEESEKDDMEASNRRMKQLERDLPRRVVIGENGWSVDCRPPVNNQVRLDATFPSSLQTPEAGTILVTLTVGVVAGGSPNEAPVALQLGRQRPERLHQSFRARLAGEDNANAVHCICLPRQTETER
eukprot:3385462-Rhodomonas_salina.4